MKVTVANYETRVTCLRIVCANGTVVRLTDYPYDLTMSNGQVYKTDAGYSPSSLSEVSTLAPSAFDLEGIVGNGVVTRDQIAGGIMDGAEMFLFRVDYLNPVEDYEECGRGWLGKTELVDEKYKIEMMSLSDALNEGVSVTCTPLCRHDLGSQGYAECGLSLASLTVTGTLTHVTSASVIRDSSRGEASDWFGAGTFRMTSGPNVGMRPIEIKAYDSDGTITLQGPLYFSPAPGDMYEMIAGCRKRRTEDCKNKFNNVLNHGGFPDLPPSSAYQSTAG